jgi:hypothetical protein
MSRSFRKTPIFGNTGSPSEKKDKQIWHQRLRSQEKCRLRKVGIQDDFFAKDIKDYSDPWSFAKDGKRWLNINKIQTYRITPKHHFTMK